MIPALFLLPSHLHLNVSDAHARQQGAVSLRPTILLAALLLENADLLALVELADHAKHLGARHERGTGGDFAVVVAHEQDLVERHLAARFAGIDRDQAEAVMRQAGAFIDGHGGRAARRRAASRRSGDRGPSSAASGRPRASAARAPARRG